MKALSVRQPWAWLIVSGHKDVENRSWPTTYRGPFLVHAGATPMSEEDAAWFRAWCERAGVVPPSPLPLGGIVGRAVLKDCVTGSASEWFEGPYGFLLEGAEPLPFLPCRGGPGFFEVRYEGPLPSEGKGA